MIKFFIDEMRFFFLLLFCQLLEIPATASTYTDLDFISQNKHTSHYIKSLHIHLFIACSVLM